MSTLVALGNAAKIDPQLAAQKQDKLFAILRDLEEVIVAYSGGTDSAYLAWAAAQALGDRAVAITADSPSIPESHKKDAAQYARSLGFRHEFVETREFENPDYARNDEKRCFHCKDELFTRLGGVARERGVAHVVYGVNCDDLGDYRPGQEAAKEHGAKSPLVDAGLTKAEIRLLAKKAGLPFWDRPAAACLSSRIPYGTAVTAEKIKRIEAGEEALRGLGFRIYRVRFHEKLVRLEFGQEDLPKALNVEMAAKLTGIFKSLGFHYVTIDLEGYRQGSLNEVLQDSTSA